MYIVLSYLFYCMAIHLKSFFFIRYLNHVYKDIFEHLSTCWLHDEFIHLMPPSFLNEFTLCMTSTSNDHWLPYLSLLAKCSNLIRSLKTIHDRHTTVHEYQTIRIKRFVPFFHQLYCLHSVMSLIYDFWDIIITLFIRSWIL